MKFTVIEKGKRPDVVLNEYLHAARNMNFIVGVTCEGTMATFKKPWGTEHDVRTAGKNITIYRSLAKKGYSFAFLMNDELAQIQRIWTVATNKYFKTTSKDNLLKDIKKLGTFMVEAIEKHIKGGRTTDGRAPISAKFTKFLKEYAGVGDNPPGVRTGQLLKSFKFTIRQIR